MLLVYSDIQALIAMCQRLMKYKLLKTKIMRRFIDTTFMRCLSNGVEEKNIKMDKAYDEFVYQLISFCRIERDLIFMSLALSYTKSEIQSLKSNHLLIQNKADCLLFIDKSLYMIDSAINIVDLRINNPQILEQSQIKIPPKSSICLDNDVGYVDIMEIACGLFYSGVLKSISGNIVNFADVARVFEVGFNIEFSDIYKKRDEVIKRKPVKRVAFLSKMIHAINMESKNRGYL